jgi:hypothetical protein
VFIDTVADKAVEIEDRIVLKEIRAFVKASCDRQPQLQRQIITGLYARGKSSLELGKELNKTANNTRIIGHRTIEAIQIDLEHHYNLHLSTDAIRTCLAN